MKSYVKMIIAGAIIIGIGLAVMLVTGFTSGWSLDNGGEFEMKTYVAEHENLNLNVDFMAGELKIEFYDGDKIKIEYPENRKYTAEFKETETDLSVITKKRHWYDFIGWSFGVSFPATNVYLPQSFKADLKLELNAGKASVAGGEYGKLELRLNAGAVSIGNVTCDELNCKINAGTVVAENAVCPRTIINLNAGKLEIRSLSSDDINAKLNAGYAELNVKGSESDYGVYLDINAGDCNLTSHAGNTDKKLTAKLNAGTLQVTFGN